MKTKNTLFRLVLLGIYILLSGTALAWPWPPCSPCWGNYPFCDIYCDGHMEDDCCSGECCTEPCCGDDCCHDEDCETCVNDECVVCGGDPNLVCDEGECVEKDVCCDECESGDPAPEGTSCINGIWQCICGMCLDGKCVDVDVYVNSFPDPDEQVINCDVTFTAETILPGYESHIAWSGGENPSTGSGQTYTTQWSTPGTKTVTATISSCDGKSTWDSEYVVIVEYTPIEDLNDLENCQNRIRTPGYTPPTNGCSAPMGNNPARDCPHPPACFGTNEDCVSTSFLGPCNTHDTCYGTCNGTSGYGKYDCETTFGADMHAVCNSLTGDEYDSCYDDCDWWADTYVTAVYIVGQSYYDAGQVAGCSCVDCM